MGLRGLHGKKGGCSGQKRKRGPLIARVYVGKVTSGSWGLEGSFQETCMVPMAAGPTRWLPVGSQTPPQPRQDGRSQNRPHRQDGGLQDSASAGVSPHRTFPSSEQGPISTGSSPQRHGQGQGQRGSHAYGSHCFVSGRRKGQCPASEEGVL